MNKVKERSFLVGGKAPATKTTRHPKEPALIKELTAILQKANIAGHYEDRMTICV
jgi:hypothetical protein